MRSFLYADRLIDGGGSMIDDHRMETRVIALEQGMLEVRERLARIEQRLDTFATTFATKEDLHREIGQQTWRLVTFVTGFSTALTCAVYFIAKHT